MVREGGGDLARGTPERAPWRAAAFLAFHRLGLRPLLDAESRYTLVGYEMFRSGDWTQPRLYTFPFYDKLPLLYWAVALSYHAFGANEFASRLPAALVHVGTTVLVFALARTLLGRGASLFAGLIYATTVGPLIFARFVFTDGLLVFCLTLSLLGLTLTTKGKPGWMLFYLGAAGAGLSKGLEGLLFRFATAAAYVLVTRDISIVAWFRPVRGFLLLAVFLPWHVALAARSGVFPLLHLQRAHLSLPERA